MTDKAKITMTQRTNWAGNYAYQGRRWHHPETVDQVRAIVTESSKAKVVGSRHSFNSIADTTEDLISLDRLTGIVALDREKRTVTVEGGIAYGQLGPYLHDAGFALHNLASLPHISIAGACATATHGSGVGNGNLATAVSAIEVVTSAGDVITLSREASGDAFHGAVVSLGGIGVITKVTLDLLPAFQVRQDVYDLLPLAQLAENFDEIVSCGYSVSLFSDWKSSTFNHFCIKRVVADAPLPELAPQWHGASLSTAARNPIPGMGPENCTEQLGVPGAWHDRLPHFRQEFTPSAGEELQSEYFVLRRNAFAALSAIDGLRGQIAPLLQTCEVRTIAADTLWMSPCYEQDSVAIHFTWLKDWERVREVLPCIEAALDPFGIRPHWGKLFTMSPATLQSRYARLADFRDLLRQYDPNGKFRNEFLDRYVF